MGKNISQRCVMMRDYKRKETLRLCERLSLSTKGEAKGGLISESFLLCFRSTKKGPNHSPEQYPSKEKMLRRVIWYFVSKT